jgi:hypothetical protein
VAYILAVKSGFPDQSEQRCDSKKRICFCPTAPFAVIFDFIENILGHFDSDFLQLHIDFCAIACVHINPLFLGFIGNDHDLIFTDIHRRSHGADFLCNYI